MDGEQRLRALVADRLIDGEGCRIFCTGWLLLKPARAPSFYFQPALACIVKRCFDRKIIFRQYFGCPSPWCKALRPLGPYRPALDRSIVPGALVARRAQLRTGR